MKDLLLEKALPHSVEIEQAILGAVFLDNRLATALERVRGDDWYVDGHRVIAEKMLELSRDSQPIDPITVGSLLMRDGEERVRGSYLCSLIDGMPRVENVESYVKTLKDKGTKRRLIAEAHGIISRCLDDEEQSAAIADSAISRFMAQKSSEGGGIIEWAEAAEDYGEELAQIKAGLTVPYVESGLRDLDAYTGGFFAGESVVIGARPSDGKSGFLFGTAEHVAGSVKRLKSDGMDRLAPRHATYITLEMPARQLVQRHVMAYVPVDSRRLRRGEISDQQYQQVQDHLRRTARMRLSLVDDPYQTIWDISATARQMKHEERLDALFIDYLQLVKGHRKADRWELMGDISRQQKLLAKELCVPAFGAVQLKRDAQGRKPTMADIRESGDFEQDADMILLLWRHEEGLWDDSQYEPMKIIVAKNRSGPRGKDIDVILHKPRTRFIDFSEEILSSAR